MAETLESSLHLDDTQSASSSSSSSPNSSSISDNHTDNANPSLTRNASSSRLNAKAPEFVPRTPASAAVSPSSSTSSSSSSSSSTTTTSVTSRPDLSQPKLVVTPPPPPPPQGVIHVYPSPNSPFHVPVPVPIAVSVPVHSHHPHPQPNSHHPYPHPHPHPHHHHHVPVQYHHHHHNHNHQRPFHGATGFLDQQDASGQHQQPAHSDPDSKNCLTDEATQKILNQVEYYFSDINLATTDHLMRFINKDPEGYVPISVVASFKKIKALVSSNSQLASILRNSSKLMVSEDGKKVKRQHLLTESDMEELQSRIVVAENLPEDHCHQNLMKVFSVVGSVRTIRTCQPQTSNGGASSASRTAKTDGMPFSNKLHAFVEYESIELAEKAVMELNEEGNWRNGLRVRLLRRPAKPAQARGKKAGHEGEASHKEDDASTSDRHEPNEKQLEDTPQLSDLQLHEHAGEEHSNDKEGVHKKGRSRGRGKGRGRPQYNHHNKGGTHVGTPLSINCVNTEHPVVGKQPPGPRMPDGTRGFSVGRGKPLPVNIS